MLVCRCVLVFVSTICCFSKAYSTNSTYITISNQIARKTQLDLVANNVANANTVGFEEDSPIFKNIDTKQTSNRSNSFVHADSMYKSGLAGNLKITNRPLDLAIGGEGYFKVITPRGFRYTLNGSMIINSEYVLVTSDGNPFASRDNQPIILPVDYKNIQIAKDGSVYADGIVVDVIGVFTFRNKNLLSKEGNNLYSAQVNDILIDENVAIVSGALRSSNVNLANVMTQMMEAQRSSGMTDNLLSDLANLERSLLTKIAK